MRRRTPGWALAGLFGLTTGLAPAAQAQTASSTTLDVGSEGVLRQEQRQEAHRLLAAPPEHLRPATATSTLTTLPHQAPCFWIDTIRFSGAHAQRLNWLAQDVQPVLGQCVGTQGLATIARVLDDHLISLGYITSRVSFPPQNLASGLLDIHLDVGTVASVRMVRADSGQPDTDWGTWRNAFPSGPGEILNIRDLEQGIEHMGRLPSQSVHTLLEPGPAPNSSIIVLQRQSASLAQRLHGGLSLDNSGSQYLGRSQLSGALSLDGPLGLNDILSLTASSNVEHPASSHRTQSLGLSYSIPWGYNTFTLSGSTVRYAQLVQGTTAQFLSSGTSQTARLQWDRTIWRTASSKFGVFGAVFIRKASGYLDDVELLVQRRATTNVDMGASIKSLLSSGGLVSAQFDYRHGIGSFGAQDDWPTASQGGLTLRPQIWGLNLSLRQPIKVGAQPWVYSATFHGQSTPDTLVSEDQISVGDRYSVRGFDGNAVLLAESGYFLRNDLSRPVALFPGWSTAAYVGLDFGRVWGPSAANLVGAKLAGAVIGLRGQTGRLQFDAGLGTPVVRPAGFATKHLNLYLSVTAGF
ncbi:ShlB/FhaC/HecB family hemolysin secretion/activation protein [Thiomonas sp. X19]|uniref:ShlB/FhaC/HecB family hemolysin secretion/activation protein n=1 Tax=Thiomonas sp. X19 TaxID=1050370 RepID=UPI000DD8CC75|nr:ShlB/FhaC/HecB family hemolysin secretion/activation protein [Thiomonas sp. X19]